MKTKVILLSLLICLGIALPAQAQLQWGIKGGVNLTSASFSKNDFKSDNRAGFFIGPMLDFKIPIIGIGADAALMFAQRKLSYDSRDGRDHGTIKQNGIDIPINLKYSLGLGNMLAVFITAGPNFFFDLDSNDRIFEKKTANIGINVGAGVKLLNHLQVACNYNIPLGRSGDIRYSDVGDALVGKNQTGIKAKTWQVSAAYLF